MVSPSAPKTPTGPASKRRARRSARREGDVVALPGVGLHVLDLPLRVIAKQRVGHVAGARIDLSVSKRTRRAGKLVDVIAALRGLPPGQDFAGQAVVNIVCRSGRASAGWREERDVGVADDRNAGLGLQVHPIDVLPQVELACLRERRAWVLGIIGEELRRVPRRPRTSELIDARRVPAGTVERIGSESCKRR